MPAPKGHAPYPGCETGGRPQKYNKEFLDSEADALEIWMEKKENLFIELFCFERGYDDNRLDEWMERSDKFRTTYKRFKTRQKGYLQQGTLSKKYQYNMAVLILGCNHGMVLKTEQKISGDSENPVFSMYNYINGTSRDLINGETSE